MSNDSTGKAFDARERAAALRASFDGSFAVAAAPQQAAQLDFIALRVAGVSYALQIAGIAAVHADLRVTRLPSSRVELLGVASLRATFAPVYDLASLLGSSVPARAEDLRWFLLSAGSPALVLAFESYEGYVRVEHEAIRPVTDHASTHVRQLVQHEAQSLPVIDLASVIAAVTALSAQGSER